jgi:hypothetical protein
VRRPQGGVEDGRVPDGLLAEAHWYRMTRSRTPAMRTRTGVAMFDMCRVRERGGARCAARPPPTRDHPPTCRERPRATSTPGRAKDRWRRLVVGSTQAGQGQRSSPCRPTQSSPGR